MFREIFAEGVMLLVHNDSVTALASGTLRERHVARGDGSGAQTEGPRDVR